MDSLLSLTTFLPLYLADGLKYAVANLNAFSLLVVFVLIVIFCWELALMLSKNSMITEEEQKLEDFREQLDRTSNPLAIFSNRNPPDGSLVDYQYRVGCREVCVHLISTAEPDEHFSRRLRHAGKIAPTQMELVRQALARAAAEGQVRLEQNQFLLQVSVLVAPGLGLLGTLFTLIEHFGSVGHLPLNGAGATSFSGYLAPALLTAALGLLLGTVFYAANHYLQRRQQRLQLELKHFSGELLSGFERLYLDHTVNKEKEKAEIPEKTGIPSSMASKDASLGSNKTPAPAPPVIPFHHEEEHPFAAPSYLKPKENLETEERIEKALPSLDTEFIIHTTDEDKLWNEEASIISLFQELADGNHGNAKKPGSNRADALMDVESLKQNSSPAPHAKEEKPDYFTGETEANAELGNKLRELRQQALRLAAKSEETAGLNENPHEPPLRRANEFG